MARNARKRESVKLPIGKTKPRGNDPARFRETLAFAWV
jgi:hypothetical protein